jgi:ribose/xylose/arabinose/galactoside ABC-type transport system permease subunit
LTAAAHRGIGGTKANRGTTMEAIYAIVLFVVVMFALNRFEFGRFD